MTNETEIRKVRRSDVFAAKLAVSSTRKSSEKPAAWVERLANTPTAPRSVREGKA